MKKGRGRGLKVKRWSHRCSAQGCREPAPVYEVLSKAYFCVNHYPPKKRTVFLA
jgi:hypothetical protein